MNGSNDLCGPWIHIYRRVFPPIVCPSSPWLVYVVLFLYLTCHSVNRTLIIWNISSPWGVYFVLFIQDSHTGGVASQRQQGMSWVDSPRDSLVRSVSSQSTHIQKIPPCDISPHRKITVTVQVLLQATLYHLSKIKTFWILKTSGCEVLG